MVACVALPAAQAHTRSPLSALRAGMPPVCHAKLAPMARSMTSAVRDLRSRPELSIGSIVLAGVLASGAAGVALARLATVQRELKAMLILIAVVALVIAALRPRVGLAMLLILAPFEYHFSGTGTDEVLIVFMALVLAWRIRWRHVPGWAALGGGALVLGSFLAAIGAQDSEVALWGGVRWLAAIVTMFVAFSALRRRPYAARRMADLLVGAAVVVVFFAFTQKAGIYLLVGAPFADNLPSSFFRYYTNYGGYAAVTAVVASGELLVALTAHNRRRATLYAAALLFIIGGLAISLSRGGLLALGVGWIVLLVLNLRRAKLVLQAVLVLAALAGAGYLYTPTSTVTRIEERFASPLGTLAEDRERFAIQAIGEQALAAHPFGIGYGNFSFYAIAHKQSSTHEDFTHAQNTPIQIGLDAGWIGLAGFALLSVVPVGLVLLRRSRGLETVRASGFAAALCGFMAQGSFDYLFFEIAFVIFFLALVWGATQALMDARVERSQSFSRAY